MAWTKKQNETMEIIRQKKFGLACELEWSHGGTEEVMKLWNLPK